MEIPIHNHTMTRNLDTTGVSPGTAIYLANSSENLIAQNTLNSNAADGLELAGSKFNLIFGNTANTNRKSGAWTQAPATTCYTATSRTATPRSILKTTTRTVAPTPGSQML